MQFEYYTLPMELGKVIKKQELPRCSLQQSIAHHLHLILTTSFGELLSDPDFGNGLWEEDFDNVTYRGRQKELIIQSLMRAIQRYEKRLEKVRVQLTVSQEEVSDLSAESRVKRKLDIVIAAILKATNEPITYRDSFFISPLAYN
ncbi:Phage baseplate assembly protein W [Filimonas lacunae]|uniref:Phage baseplate assembly protein W n=1 Tax=Filimonas lacunae TaxID=477680 RepID=A0A173MR88_9BACT|nr:GPW/gp25 family protein [Filimonas lacunae]BAV10173.1 hypothetical protein FLA_6233 [Filimonas lacunae]SIT18619.1 Phage baseplate assembly protein W [Filimonas lacunae]